MSIRNLDRLMAPRSVVVIGASARKGSVGEAVTRNLLAGGFAGAIHLVNVKGGEIAGRPVAKTLAELEAPADLAVVMTPPGAVPGLIDELGRAGTKVAVVLTAGPGSGASARTANAQWRERLLKAAQPHLLRIVGPNCIGFAAPRLGLNASFGPEKLKAGQIAAVAQSGAVLAALADWGSAQGIGFSHLLSMGDMADVDFGDMLDMLARDHETRAVLMYVEGVTHGRKFMSAARGVARIKPVIVLKAGRHAAAAEAAASHTGAMAGSAAVYDAAFARAGLVQVRGLGELFDAAETLGHSSVVPRNERLAILSNGGGVAVTTTDLLLDNGGELAALAPQTLAALDEAMPRIWSRGNPADIGGDADGPRYAAALDALAADRGVGTVLVVNVPTALTSAEAAARDVAAAPGARSVPVMGCWIGGPDAEAGRRLLHDRGIPAYDTPLRAVRGFMHIVQYRRGRRALQRTPPSIPETPVDTVLVRRIVAAALAEERELLTGPEARQVLAAYGIATAPPGDAAAGLPESFELILGATEDPVFGPIVMVGHGGVAAEVIDDKALALPPLDAVLAEDALSRTRIDRLLRGYGDRPPMARAAVGEAMIRLSQLIADVDEVAELDINPLVVDRQGVVARGSRIVVRAPLKSGRAARFAIRPYPVELETTVQWGGQSLRIRPIRPQDEEMIDRFAAHLSPEDIRLRFFGPIKQLTHEMAARLTQIDYDREMAFLLLDGGELLGVGRLAAESDFELAEFALVVASGRQRRGYGELLLRHVVDYARTRGIKRVVGYVLRENRRMLALAERLGFERQPGAGGGYDLSVLKLL